MDQALRSRRKIVEPVRTPVHPKHSHSVLLDWDEIPEWQQDNEYILTGYRPVSGSYKESWRSIWTLHNETINIHSHFVGAGIFVLLSAYFYYSIFSHYPTASYEDAFVFATFFYGVATCFVLSSTFHIINNHSPVVAQIGNQLDYLGIVVLMWGSTLPSIYYGFYCDRTLQKVYSINVSILALGCAIATLHSRFRHPTWRPYRAAMYAGLGLSAIVFVIHGLVKYGFETQRRHMGVDWMAAMASFNLFGAAIYGIRVSLSLFCI
ncbi:hypothetical protein MMC10_000972 [Thelotrema lepadinum]|nr:hypothetical protein [Thelotrema lepadinum]